MAQEKIGVLLVARGAPDKLKDVEPYLLNIRGPKRATPALIEDFKNRYQAIGGKSPLLDITRSQAHALEDYLNSRFTLHASRFTTYVGMAYWHPFIQEALRQVVADSLARLIVLALAPQYSSMSTGLYFKKVEEEARRLNAAFKISYVKSWPEDPNFLKVLAQQAQSALKNFSPEERKNLGFIFTAHSLPLRALNNQDPYVDEAQKTASGLAKLLGLKTYRLAFQSKSPLSAEPWLGPSVEEALDELTKKNHSAALIVPIGFVSDHLETLYDIDVFYQQYAKLRGIRLERAPSLNNSTLFIEALASIIKREVAQ